MSQWGAYGWSVDRGWNWIQILDHYYGNTQMADVDTSGTIDVRLTALDNATTLGVVSYVGEINGARGRLDGGNRDRPEHVPGLQRADADLPDGATSAVGRPSAHRSPAQSSSRRTQTVRRTPTA